MREELSVLLARVTANWVSHKSSVVLGKKNDSWASCLKILSVVLRSNLGSMLLTHVMDSRAWPNLGDPTLVCPDVRPAILDKLLHFHILSPWNTEDRIYDL